MGGQAGQRPPDGQRLIPIQSQALGHHRGPESQDRRPVDGDRQIFVAHAVIPSNVRIEREAAGWWLSTIGVVPRKLPLSDMMAAGAEMAVKRIAAATVGQGPA